MVGLGTIFIAVSAIAVLLLWRNKLDDARWMLWILLLLAPFPYIANTAGWMTAELGRQPWVIYGLLRTVDGYQDKLTPVGLAFLCTCLAAFLVPANLTGRPRLFPKRQSAQPFRFQTLPPKCR
jgi:cytochrome bd-type quinol oxidase subunit 1